MPRPPIDLATKVCEIVQHVEALPAEAQYPLSHYNYSSTNLWNLRLYFVKKIKGGGSYPTVAARHLAGLDRMLLVNQIETFERFLKEIAAVCVDHLAKCVLDDRFDAFAVKGSLLAAHFEADTLGKSLCESEVWLDCDSINKRFRRLLADPFDQSKGHFYLFPNKGQQPQDEQFRYPIVAIIWQLRHAIIHNVGVITQSDAAKLRLLVRGPVESPRLLNPTRDDLRYVKRFLDETAQKANERVGLRLAELLTLLHAENPTLFLPQEKAADLKGQFDLPLTVAGATA